MLQGLWRIGKGSLVEIVGSSQLADRLTGRRSVLLHFIHKTTTIKVFQALGKNLDPKGFVDPDDREKIWYRLRQWEALGGITYFPREQWDSIISPEENQITFEGSLCPEWFLTVDAGVIYGRYKTQNQESLARWHQASLKKLHDLQRCVSMLLTEV